MRSLSKNELMQLVGGIKNDKDDEDLAIVLGIGIGIFFSKIFLKIDFPYALLGAIIGELVVFNMGSSSWPKNSTV